MVQFGDDIMETEATPAVVLSAGVIKGYGRDCWKF